MASTPRTAAALVSPVGPQYALRAGIWSLVLLSLGHFFIDLYSSAIGAFQPLLVTKLSLSLRQAGVIGGVLIFFSSVMQPLYGFLSDRLHSKLFTALAPAVAGIFISALAIAPSFGWVLVAAALGGAGIASFHPQGSAWAAAAMDTNKGRWVAIFISAGTLGMAMGPAFFSTLISRFGFEYAIWAAIPGVLVTLVLLLRLPAAPAPTSSGRLDLAPLIAVRGPLTVHYFLVFIRSIIQITYAQFLPLYLLRERGFSLTEANYSLSLYLACGAVGGLTGGHLADRFGGRIVIWISMLGCLPFLSLFFLTTGFVSIVSLALGGLLLLFTIPVNVVMAQQLAPSQSGTISALMMGFAWGMAGLLFIPLTGWVSDVWSMHEALRALLVFPLIGFLLAWKLPRD